MFEELYLPAIENGVDAVAFWDMTYKEIIAAIEGNQRRVKSEFQIQATLIYRLGNLVGCAVNDPAKYPTIHKAFPGLFEEPKVKQQNWELMKERIAMYAAERRKRGEKNGDDARRAPNPDHK